MTAIARRTRGRLVLGSGVLLVALSLRAQEDDYEFRQPGGYPLDVTTVRLAEGFPGLGAEPGKDRWLEPADGAGGFDIAAPRLGAEDGPGGIEWDISPTYRTRYKGSTDFPAGSGMRVQGNNWFLRIPYAAFNYYGTTITVRFDANTLRVYDKDYTGVFWGRYANKNSKIVVTGTSPNRTLSLFDTGGKTYTFLETQSFKCTKVQGLGGAEVTITYNSGDITVLQKPSATSGSEVRKFVYTLSAGATRLDKIDVYEKNGANWDLYVKVDFTYFEDVTGAVEGTTGDLIGVKLERLLSPASTWLERRWRMCYWTGTFNSSTNPGYPYQVRSVVGPQEVRDFEVANPGVDIYTKTTSQLASYVDFTAEYEADKRVDKLDLKAGCGCGGSEGLYTFDWAVYAGTPSDLNSWAHQVLVTYPSANGGKLIVDYNKYHQVLNRVFQEVASDSSSRRWIRTYRHDTTGRLTDSYSVKASTLYTDLTHTVTTSLTAGMRRIFAYASNDSLSTVKLRDPANGNENYQLKTVFTLFVSGDRRRYVLDSTTVYPSETTADTGGKQTSFSYTYHSSDNIAPKLRTTTLPVVSSGENGSGTAVVLKDYFELDGLHTWSKDGDGYVHYSGYDSNRRTLTLRVRDLNTSSPPSGVPSPPDTVFNTSSGLNLTEAWEYDSQRRPTKHEGPAFNAWDGTSIASTKTTQRWWYTKLSGGESVVVQYPHLDSAYFHAALSITVANHEGQSLTSALGELSAAYRDTTLSDDFDPTQSTLAAAFHGTIVRRQDRVYTGDKLTQEQVWSDADNGSADKFTTTHTYNSLGQREKTTSPAGTITKSGFDVLGRRKWTKLGTVDGGAGDDMTLTDEVFYDDEEDSSSNVGEGLVTRTKRYPNQGSQVRETSASYDYRGRRILTVEPGTVKFTWTYDNLNRPLVSERFDNTFPLAPELVSKSESIYDSLGRIYESREYEVPLGTNKYSNTLTWRNARGLVVKIQSGGKRLQKIEYDGAGRTVNLTVSLDTDETAYGDSDDLVGDTVVNEQRVVLDPTGAVELVRHYERKPNVSGEGPLTLTTARAQYTASWYDKLHRQTVAVSYGANGGTDMTSRPTGSPPSSSDSSKLVTKSTYTPKSELETTTDPMGIVTRTEYFDFGEVSKLIENYHNPAGSDPDDDRTTEYTFDSAGRHWKTTAKASGSDQVTENIWGVVKNTDNSTVSSNDLLYKEKQPDTTEVDVVAYNALGEMIWKKDSHGTEHVYEYDERGRLLHDRATVLGTGIDGEIRRISWTYDKLDRKLKVTSYDNATVGSGTVKNEVQFEYGPYSTVTKVYEEWGGAVNTSTSKKVQQAWSFPTSGATGVRRTSTTYPDGLVVDDVYNSGTDATISDVLNRRSGADNQGSELYREQSFLGISRLLRRSFAGTAAVWTMDFGGALDTHNRPADLYTQDASQVMLNRYQYGYNLNSQITSRLDLVGNVSGSYEFNEDFQYDELGRLLKHRRGKDLDTGTPVIRVHECWTLDRSGNKTAYYNGTASTCGSTWTGTFNGSNEFATWSGGTVSYDQKGHMTEKGSYDYTYDAWGRMVKVVWGGWLDTGIYKYNGLNQRIYAKDVNANETRYYFDLSWRVLEERKPSDDSLIRWYVFGDQYVDDLVVEGPTKRYHVQDIRFNTVSRLDANGVVDLRFLYDGYGTPKALSADWTTWQTISREYSLFTDRGYRNDHAHYDFRDRFHDPELGVLATRGIGANPYAAATVAAFGLALPPPDSSAPCCVLPQPNIRKKGDAWLCDPNLVDRQPGVTLPGGKALAGRIPPPGPDVDGRYWFETTCNHSGPCRKCTATQSLMLAHNANATLVSEVDRGLRASDLERRPHHRAYSRGRPLQTGAIAQDYVNSHPCCERDGKSYLHNTDGAGPFKDPHTGSQGLGDLIFFACFVSSPSATCRYERCCIDFQIAYRPVAEPILTVIARWCQPRSGGAPEFFAGSTTEPSPNREGFPESPHSGVSDEEWHRRYRR
jgi:YD repeat-containing protein